MEYRKLGTTGLKLSELSLGCMTFGRESSEEESHKMIDKFIEVGGNFLDQAVYWKGKPDVSSLAGRPVRLLFKLKRAKLYAFQFTRD